MYNVKIDEFEGPLDLLLHLIKQSNIDIYDIKIEEITNQYLEYIRKMEELNIDIASSYLVMAAELMEIKSKSLLPKEKEEEVLEESEEVSRENLIKKLIEYKKYKEITSSFKELELSRKEIYIKPPEIISNYVEIEKQEIRENADIDILVEAFSKFLERQKLNKPLTTKVTRREISVKERRVYIKNILKTKKRVEFNELFEDFSKDYIVVTFLSILEMVKNSELNITQENNFAKIFIELR